jgi:CubicO group peptidase (beta-lactamase class C family)
MFDLKHWHGIPLTQHLQLYTDASKAGYTVLTMSQYGTPSAPLYAMVMIKRANNPEQKAFWAKTRDEFQSIFDNQVKAGLGPVLLTACGEVGNVSFAGIWEKKDPIPLTRLYLTDKPGSKDTSTIQGMNLEARTRGLRPLCIASYGIPSNPGFAAIWQPNTGDDAVLWNADGTLERENDVHARDAAEFSTWCRPVYRTLNKGQQHCSVFEASNTGKFAVADEMTAGSYTTEFDKQVNAGMLPICVQAAGDDNDAARFSAIFVEREKPLPRQWTAEGPVSNAAIEAKIRTAMTSSIIRDATVAIVYKKRLVYARGFTFAEAGWPVVEPTTRFRLASCSKTVTALAIFQLIEEGKLKLSDPVQKILQLKTPNGLPPIDPRFSVVTIQMLLEHRSGLRPREFESVPDLQKAFTLAGKTASLPIGAADQDAFIATLVLASNPNTASVYNNCGYYLLGRVVKQLRGTSTPIDAYQKHLFDPLKITRIKRAKDLVTDQEPGEARYHDPEIPVGTSVFPGFTVLPSDYGTLRLEILDGDGGLTAAATDMARLLAILVSSDDSPALKRQTIVTMFGNGVTNHKMNGGRSGYGFDGISDLGGGSFYAQKGGTLASAHSVVEINGDWACVAVWGGNPVTAPWYPNYLEEFSPDKDVLVSGDDLFPHFGMPSL